MTELQEMSDKELFGNAEEEASEADASEADASEAGSEADMSDVEEQKESEAAEKEYDSEVEEEEDDESDFDSEAEPDEEYNLDGGVSKKKKRVGGAKTAASGAEEEGEEEESSSSGSESDSDDDDYLQKFSQNMREDLISNFHPESKSHNYEEIKQLAKVTRNKNGIIVDELHKTIPILTKYEKTRILGQRAKQIETGAVTLVQVPPNIIDSYLIAKLELAQGKIPFIIRRPLPNGGMEYWYVSDLEDL